MLEARLTVVVTAALLADEEALLIDPVMVKGYEYWNRELLLVEAILKP